MPTLNEIENMKMKKDFKSFENLFLKADHQERGHFINPMIKLIALYLLEEMYGVVEEDISEDQLEIIAEYSCQSMGEKLYMQLDFGRDGVVSMPV